MLRACSRISPVRIDRFAPDKVSRPAPTLAGMSHAIALTDEQWEPVADLFEPPGRRGAPAQIPRRQMVEAMLFVARTGCQWRLPARALRLLDRGLGPVAALALERRVGPGGGAWRSSPGCSTTRSRSPRWSWSTPRRVKGGRYGPTFHEAGGRGGRTTGTKRTLLVLGRLPRLAGGCLTGANPRPVPGSARWSGPQGAHRTGSRASRGPLAVPAARPRRRDHHASRPRVRLPGDFGYRPSVGARRTYAAIPVCGAKQPATL